MRNKNYIYYSTINSRFNMIRFMYKATSHSNSLKNFGKQINVYFYRKIYKKPFEVGRIVNGKMNVGFSLTYIHSYPNGKNIAYLYYFNFPLSIIMSEVL
jgi:hypothetical protein